ncbi:MAG: ATP-binding protein [Wenzhouxiangella sp.]
MPRPRKFAAVLLDLADQYPVLTLTGPRQSGKTTLCRSVFPDYGYVNLEPLDQRQFAREDPRGLLAEFPGGVIVDEIQHVPELLGYIQEAVDEDGRPGRFVLTGSQHFSLSASIGQSLAGRTAVLQLLPLSLEEYADFSIPLDSLFDVLFAGGYPRIHDRSIAPERWLADYVATYVERDVRQIANVSDLGAFSTFLRLCASHTAQEINLSALGADAGVSHNTAKAWLSILETSFLIVRCPAWHRNLRKQLVKRPKLHFLDSGLVCHLLGIRSADELRHHPLRGPIFESWVASEIYKHLSHRGNNPRCFHYREARGVEIDILLQSASGLIACEAKSGATLQPDFMNHLRVFSERVSTLLPQPELDLRLVYGGDRRQQRSGVECLGWRQIHAVEWG